MFEELKYKYACKQLKKYNKKKMKDEDYRKMLKYWDIKVGYEVEKRTNVCNLHKKHIKM